MRLHLVVIAPDVSVLRLRRSFLICYTSTMIDKYKAVWISHSSLSDYLKCPKLYYLHNVYKDPKTRRKMSIVTPHMSLGIAVHNVLEGLVEYNADERMRRDLHADFEEEWKKVSGRKGGFLDDAQEKEFKGRGSMMIQRAINNPDLFNDKTIKLKEELPHFFLSEEDGIILCGKIDWIRYIEATDTVELYDFKTGKHKEDDSSLQLPIYTLIMKYCQKRNVSGAYYWYLQTDDDFVTKELPDVDEAYKKVLEIGKKVKATRESGVYDCPTGGCRECEQYEKILRGEAEYVGVGGYNQDLYIL